MLSYFKEKSSFVPKICEKQAFFRPRPSSLKFSQRRFFSSFVCQVFQLNRLRHPNRLRRIDRRLFQAYGPRAPTDEVLDI